VQPKGNGLDEDPFSGTLLPGEHIRWSGRPGRGLLLSPRDVFLIPFSLLWCGFAIFWEASVSTTHAPPFFLLWGAMFVCIGLYFVAGRFAFDAWVRRGMRYALTDSRILIARPRPFAGLTAIAVDRVADIQFTELSGNRGTIRFGPPMSMFGRSNGASWSPALDPTPQFLAIDDGRTVFDMVQRVSHRG
jgi:hypothetical protein